MRRSKPFIETPRDRIEDGSGAPTVAAPPETPIATPGNTERKKDPLPAPEQPKEEKPKGRPRKLLTPEELTTEETKLRTKYPHLIENTLINATKNQPIDGLSDSEVQKFHHKRSCLIKCSNCELQRRIATSDLAQVTLCENCTKDERNRRKRERRAATKK